MIIEIAWFLHYVGIAFGVGGATIASFILAKSAKDPEIGKVSAKLHPGIVKFIWLGLVLLIISGILLQVYSKWPLNTQMLILKHILVAWIIIFGVTMGLKMKKMRTLVKEKNQKAILRVSKQMKALGIINLILWYLVVIISILI